MTDLPTDTFPNWCIERNVTPEIALEWCWTCWAFAGIGEFGKLMSLSWRNNWHGTRDEYNEKMRDAEFQLFFGGTR